MECYGYSDEIENNWSLCVEISSTVYFAISQNSSNLKPGIYILCGKLWSFLFAELNSKQFRIQLIIWEGDTIGQHYWRPERIFYRVQFLSHFRSLIFVLFSEWNESVVAISFVKYFLVPFCLVYFQRRRSIKEIWPWLRFLFLW